MNRQNTNGIQLKDVKQLKCSNMKREIKDLDKSKKYYALLDGNVDIGMIVQGEPITMVSQANIAEVAYIFPELYEVEIPSDAKIWEDGQMYKVDKVIIKDYIDVFDDFDRWFDKGIYNYEEHTNFWYDRERYNYQDRGSEALAKYCSKYFDKWFVKELYDYKLHSDDLAKYCKDNFEKWYDVERYNFDDASEMLAWHLPEKFHQWFNSEKYNYESGLWALAQYCSKHFNEWFIPEKIKFNYWNVGYLDVFCSKYWNKIEPYVDFDNIE